VGDGQGAPPQNGARSGAERAANATEVKIVVSGNARAWRTIARAALRRGRGARDSEDGDRVCDCCSRKRVRCSPNFDIYVGDDKQESARVTYHKSDAKIFFLDA